MQHFETRFGEWVIAARWPIIVLTVILVAVAASGALFLKLSIDYRMFFTGDNPEFLAFESLQNTYGKSDNVVFMVVPEDGDATSEQALATVAWLTERAWQTPYSTRVDSIANFQHTTADGDDLSVRDLVDPAKLADAKERSRVRATALADPRLAGSLLARDGGVSAVSVTVGLPEEDLVVRVPEVASFARGLATEVEERFPGVDVRVVGSVMIYHAFSEASIASQKTFLPASLGVMAVVLGLLSRGLAGVAATGIVIVLSVLTAMGLGGWVGLPLTPTAAPAPTIVLMIVVANCVHLLVTAQQRLRAGDSQRAAIVESVRVNLYPIFLASLTTALGFLSMNFSEVPPYRHLGTFVAFGVVASFVLAVTFLPALLSLLPMRAPAAGSGRRSDDGRHRGVRGTPPDGAAVGVGGGGPGAACRRSTQRTERRPGAFLRREPRVSPGYGLPGPAPRRQHGDRVLARLVRTGRDRRPRLSRGPVGVCRLVPELSRRRGTCGSSRTRSGSSTRACTATTRPSTGFPRAATLLRSTCCSTSSRFPTASTSTTESTSPGRRHA